MATGPWATFPVSGAAFPAFTIPGYGIASTQTLGNSTAALGNATAVARIQTPILDRQILDSVSWQLGKHAFKFGADRRLPRNAGNGGATPYPSVALGNNGSASQTVGPFSTATNSLTRNAAGP